MRRPSLLVTADGGYRRGQVVPLKQMADEALRETPSIKNVVVVQRHAGSPIPSGITGRSRPLVSPPDARRVSHACEPEAMDSEDMLYILYTSGTTGKPKGIVHTTGGYLVGTYATTKWVFDLKDDDVYWCTADIGWVTGHSYVVYGPLANGATVVDVRGGAGLAAEGSLLGDDRAPRRHDLLHGADRDSRRSCAGGRSGRARRDLSSLRLLGSVGEPINPEAWIWYHLNIGRERCPIVDTWWQTETGMIMITPLPGITSTKPGSATQPFPGISAEIRDATGQARRDRRRAAGADPPVAGDAPRYLRRSRAVRPTVLEPVERRRYFTGDGARRDEDGFYWLLGRVDDVLNVAGHRLGTMEVESALVDHPKVAEAAVVGRPHEIKGQAVAAFVTVKEGIKPSDGLADELKEHVVKKIGAIARPDEILFAADLPKTRSGKIMRRLLRDIAEGKALGDTTTLADPAVVARLKADYEDKEG